MYTYNVDTRLYGIPAYSLSFYRVFCVFNRSPIHNNFDTDMTQYSLIPDVSMFHGIIVSNSQLFPVLNNDE